jgi:hypothetical protein
MVTVTLPDSTPAQEAALLKKTAATYPAVTALRVK